VHLEGLVRLREKKLWRGLARVGEAGCGVAWHFGLDGFEVARVFGPQGRPASPNGWGERLVSSLSIGAQTLA